MPSAPEMNYIRLRNLNPCYGKSFKRMLGITFWTPIWEAAQHCVPLSILVGKPSALKSRSSIVRLRRCDYLSRFCHLSQSLANDFQIRRTLDAIAMKHSFRLMSHPRHDHGPRPTVQLKVTGGRPSQVMEEHAGTAGGFACGDQSLSE